jgi:ketosteroid isomerase-like protein
MSAARERNLAVVQRYADAWKRGDAAAVVACYHDDLTLHWFGASPMAGSHRGRAAAIAALVRVQQLTNRKLLEIRDVIASDDHVVLLTRERFERDGRTLDLDRVLVFTIRADRLFECWLYDEDQRAVDEFWS